MARTVWPPGARGNGGAGRLNVAVPPASGCGLPTESPSTFQVTVPSGVPDAALTVTV